MAASAFKKGRRGWPGGPAASSAAMTGGRMGRWPRRLVLCGGIGAVSPTLQAQSKKVFLLLFVHKKKALILAFAAA